MIEFKFYNFKKGTCHVLTIGHGNSFCGQLAKVSWIREEITKQGIVTWAEMLWAI
jgi:hypothetical protein